jgi:MFS family permease
LNPRNVPILSISQALAACGPPIVVLLGGILGAELAPSPVIATLPVSMQVVGLALATIPAAFLMQRSGRRRGFQFGLSLASGSALLAAFAIQQASFILLCLSTFLIGSTAAFVQQYRFAATESVPQAQAGRAVSYVMIGGLFAGFLGPEIAKRTASLFPPSIYTGSFITLAFIYLLALLVISFYRDNHLSEEETSGTSRPLRIIIRQPLFLTAVLAGAAGYGVMSFIMTATPLHMHTHSGFSISATAFIIQSHIIAMYAPSLFTGRLIEKFGVLRIMLAGVACLLFCVGIAILSRDLLQYWLALVLLGIGWNFLFVGGTVLLTRTYLPAERFKSQAANDFTIFGSQAVSSLFAGSVLFLSSWDILILINLPVLLITAGLLILMRNRIRSQVVAA